MKFGRGIQIGWVLMLSVILVTLLRTEDSYVSRLFDLPSFLVIVLPVGLIAIYARLKMKTSSSAILSNLSIPTALLASMIGTIQIMSSLDDPAVLLYAVSYILLPLLYGAVLTMIGYFFPDKPQESLPNISIIDVGICIGIYPAVFLTTIIFLTQGNITSLLLFINPEGLLFSGLCIGTAIIFAEKTKKLIVSISDGAFASTALSVVASIILFFIAVGVPEIIRSVLLIGCYGLFYGVLIHIVCYFFALQSNALPELNYGTKNWHLVELSSFFLFIFFAPPTLLEIFTS